MVARIAGAQVTNYGGVNYQGLHDSTTLLQKCVSLLLMFDHHMLNCQFLGSTVTNIGQRATYYSDMQGFLALTKFKSMSEEIQGYFAHLDVCLLRFSVRPYPFL